MGFTEVNWINPCQCVVRDHTPSPQTKGSKLVGTYHISSVRLELFTQKWEVVGSNPIMISKQFFLE